MVDFHLSFWQQEQEQERERENVYVSHVGMHSLKILLSNRRVFCQVGGNFNLNGKSQDNYQIGLFLLTQHFSCFKAANEIVVQSSYVLPFPD